MAHRVAPEAETELGEIWYYIAKASGSLETADRLVDSITDRFWLLANYPHLGRSRDQDLRPGLRSFSVGEYIIFYRIQHDDVFILHVIPGSQDIDALLQ